MTQFNKKDNSEINSPLFPNPVLSTRGGKCSSWFTASIPTISYIQTSRCWMVLSSDWLVKCNVDGSVRSRTEDAGYGGVFRDASGAWVVGFAWKIGSSLLSELWGILTTLKMRNS